jgi:serine/threonine protein kinase
MAIESLTDRNFSSQSDVWSFGVVLWELFSLGKVPYPGIPVDRLIHRLLDGYRMEKPELASHKIGQLMNDCWKVEPSERPTFNQLEAILSNHLEEPVLNRRKANVNKQLGTHSVKLNQDKRVSIFLEMKAKFLLKSARKE